MGQMQKRPLIISSISCLNLTPTLRFRFRLPCISVVFLLYHIYSLSYGDDLDDPKNSEGPDRVIRISAVRSAAWEYKRNLNLGLQTTEVASCSSMFMLLTCVSASRLHPSHWT